MDEKRKELADLLDNMGKKLGEFATTTDSKVLITVAHVMANTLISNATAIRNEKQ